MTLWTTHAFTFCTSVTKHTPGHRGSRHPAATRPVSGLQLSVVSSWQPPQHSGSGCHGLVEVEWPTWGGSLLCRSRFSFTHCHPPRNACQPWGPAQAGASCGGTSLPSRPHQPQLSRRPLQRLQLPLLASGKQHVNSSLRPYALPPVSTGGPSDFSDFQDKE